MDKNINAKQSYKNGIKLPFDTSDLIPVLTLAILVIASSFLSSAFFTSRNITNLLRQNAGAIVIAMGMLLVILTGGIDLSVGSVVAFSNVLIAHFCQTMPTTVAFIYTLGISVVIGCVAGYLVSYCKLAPFVITLASMTITRGLAYMISKGAPINLPQGSWLIPFALNSWLGIPQLAWVAVGIFALVAATLTFTGFGRLIKAIGSNESAVRLSGIRTNLYKMMVYVISAALCAVGGMISNARTMIGTPLIGEGMELDAIAAVVIGGANLSGGRGKALNTLMGVFILALIRNIMNLMNVASYPQQIIKGIIIILAVLLQSGLFKRKK